MTYERITLNGVRWWTAPTFTRHVREGPFAHFDRVRQEALVVKDLRTKRTLEYHDGKTTWIIRIHKSGSLWRRLAAFIKGTRAHKELVASQAVSDTGIPSVPVAAVAEWNAGSAAIFQKLNDWTSLELLLRASPDLHLIRRYGLFARQAHDAGILQEDFNPSNVLVRGHEMRLIDYERLEVRRTLTQAQRLRIVAKLLRLVTIGRAGLDAFLDGYLKPGESRNDERRRIITYALEQEQRDRARLKINCMKENRNFGRMETSHLVGHYRKMHPGHDGLDYTQALGISNHASGFAVRPHPDVMQEWRNANLRALEGGPIPMVAWRHPRARQGFIAYRASPNDPL